MVQAALKMRLYLRASCAFIVLYRQIFLSRCIIGRQQRHSAAVAAALAAELDNRQQLAGNVGASARQHAPLVTMTSKVRLGKLTADRASSSFFIHRFFFPQLAFRVTLTTTHMVIRQHYLYRGSAL